jgi:hypothetical protein
VQHEPVHFGPTTQGGLLFRGHLLGGGRSACNQHAISANQHAID